MTPKYCLDKFREIRASLVDPEARLAPILCAIVDLQIDREEERIELDKEYGSADGRL